MKPRVEEKVPQTEFVQPWEKAWALRETNHLTRDYRSLRRWQFIYVLRDDAIAEWVRDLGPAASFPDCSELRIFSLFQDEVQALIDQAEDMRNESRLFQEMLFEHQRTSTLIPDTLAWAHERQKQRLNASTFGPGFTKQRNLFARKATS